MIDFPALFPSLVKYLPNWMERFYPSLAQFARGEGYPCGNKGVFIPRRNNCWTHPKTGNRLTKPLTYQKYQEAKEKSQKSRTEAGRTALQNREQGFRDKAREKVKGWQNKREEDINSRPIPKHPTITETPFREVNQLLGLRGYSLPDSSDMSKYFLYTAADKVRKDIKSEQDVVDEIKSNPRFNDEMSKLFGIPDTEEKIKLKQQSVDYFDKHSAKWKPIQDQELKAKVDRMAGKPSTKSEPKPTPDSDAAKRAIADIGKVKSGQILLNPKQGYRLEYRGNEAFNLSDPNLSVRQGGMSKKLTEKEAVDFLSDKYKSKTDPKPIPNSIGVKGAGGKTLDLSDLAKESRANILSKNKEAISKNLEGWKQVVGKLESGEGISKNVNLNEYEKLMDNLGRDLTLNRSDPSNVGFKKITGSIYKTLNKAVRRDPLTQEDLEKAHPNFRPIMQRMKKTFTKQNELSDKRQQSQKELDLLKHRQSYNESIVRSNSRQFREMGIDNNYNELRLLTKRNPNDMVEVRNPVSNLPERTVTLPERLNEINRDIRDLSDDKKAQISQDRAKEEIARLQKPIKDSEGRVNSLTSEIKTLRESRGESGLLKRKRTKKNDFNANLTLANFAKPGCCCEASKPLKRRKTKLTPRLKRRGNRYA